MGEYIEGTRQCTSVKPFFDMLDDFPEDKPFMASIPKDKLSDKNLDLTLVRRGFSKTSHKGMYLRSTPIDLSSVVSTKLDPNTNSIEIIYFISMLIEPPPIVHNADSVTLIVRDLNTLMEFEQKLKLMDAKLKEVINTGSGVPIIQKSLLSSDLAFSLPIYGYVKRFLQNAGMCIVCHKHSITIEDSGHSIGFVTCPTLENYIATGGGLGFPPETMYVGTDIFYIENYTALDARYWGIDLTLMIDR